MSTNRPTARDGFVRGNQPGNTLARRSLFAVLSLGLIILVALVQVGENGVFSFFHLQEREDQLQQEVVDLEVQNLEMAQQLEALAEDPEALEKLAREKQNMRRPDEEVLMVLPPAADD